MRNEEWGNTNGLVLDLMTYYYLLLLSCILFHASPDYINLIFALLKVSVVFRMILALFSYLHNLYILL